MRIGYFGDGTWACDALGLLLADGRFTVTSVTTRHQREDPNLRAMARRDNIPYLPTADVNSDEFLETLQRTEPDILVSMSYDQIFKKRIINATAIGVINCHAGALPFYRGRNPLNWALLNGERFFGVTVHFIDEGIDTGDVIVQELLPIGIDDTYEDLNKRSHLECASALIRGLRMLHDGTATRRKQIMRGRGQSYFSSRRTGDEWIDWSWTSNRIHNFIRAISPPGPCARTLVHDAPVALIRSKLVHDSPPYIGTCGEVVGRDQDGVYVKTGDTMIQILAVANFDKSGDLTERRTPRYRLGTRLGTRLLQEVISLRQEVDELKQKLSQLDADNRSD